MTSSVAKLFEPVQLGTLSLANRVVMAPMTRSFSPNGIPGQNVADYYVRRVQGGCGLIISEGTPVNRPASMNDPNVPHFFGDEALAGWKSIIDQVHAAGGKMMPQLWHVGAIRNPMTEWRPPAPQEGPSGLSKPGRQFGQTMTEADVEATIAAFAQAAADAHRLGFDGIELHGAHGYLIDQFFWEGTNTRDDRWGGKNIAERSRFAVEIIKACRAATSPDFPIVIRLSQWKQQDYPARLALTPDEMASWLQPLADAGANILHLSQRRFWEPEFEGSDLNFAGWAKKLTGLPVITVGSVGLSGEFIASFGGEASAPAPLDDLIRRLDRGDFDLVAVGRALIVDPDWAHKVRDGRMSEMTPYSAKALFKLV